MHANAYIHYLSQKNGESTTVIAFTCSPFTDQMPLVMIKNLITRGYHFILLAFCSILLHTGEEHGMKKDRVLLLDETIVPASMTQLREVI